MKEQNEKGIAFSEQQFADYSSGKAVELEGMTSKDRRYLKGRALYKQLENAANNLIEFVAEEFTPEDRESHDYFYVSVTLKSALTVVHQWSIEYIDEDSLAWAFLTAVMDKTIKEEFMKLTEGDTD